MQWARQNYQKIGWDAQRLSKIGEGIWYQQITCRENSRVSDFSRCIPHRASTLVNSDNVMNILCTRKTCQLMRIHGSHFPTFLPLLMNFSNVFIDITPELLVSISLSFLAHYLLTHLFWTPRLPCQWIPNSYYHPFQYPPVTPHHHILPHFPTSSMPMFHLPRLPLVLVVSFVLHHDLIPIFQADEDPRCAPLHHHC